MVTLAFSLCIRFWISRHSPILSEWIEDFCNLNKRSDDGNRWSGPSETEASLFFIRIVILV